MTALTALAYFAGITLVLPLIYAGYRVPLMLTGKRSADHWTRGRTEDDPGLIIRLKHAHMNCIENIGPFAVVVLIAAVTDKTSVTNMVAQFVVYARLVQIAAHAIGTSFLLVSIRATMFIIQLLLMLYMLSSLF